jgi:hypothetical protein
MNDECKKPLWPWIVALLIGLPVLYVVSIGPAFWIHQRTGTGGPAMLFVYRPILNAFNADSPWQRMLDSYLFLGIESGSSPCEQDGDILWLRESPP